MGSTNNRRTLTQKEATEVFMKYCGYVRGVAFAAAPIASLSEDIAHDTYLCFIENVANWDYSEEKIKPLLKSLARNMAARAWKRQMRQTSETLRTIAEFMQKESYNDIEFHTSYHSLEERIGALRDCLAKLSVESRALIEKIYFENTPCVELADEKKISTDALYMQISRTRARLHQCVSKTMGTEQ